MFPTPKVTTAIAPAKKVDFPFGPRNYRLMLVGLVIIVIGFILMAGTSDIYDFRKITLAPIVVLAGFGLEIYAIMMRPKGVLVTNEVAAPIIVETSTTKIASPTGTNMARPSNSGMPPTKGGRK